MANKKKEKVVEEIKQELNETNPKETMQHEEQTNVVEEPKTKEPWKADLNRMICLKNLSRGKLIYKSKRQIGYMIEWEKTGSTNYMELGEFISLKNSDRRFITEPWIRVVEDDEIEILKYANIYQFYQELIEVKEIEELFNMDFERFKRKFDKLPEGYKNTVAERAAQMIKQGQLDSIKVKKHIEEKMDIDLDFLSSFSKSDEDN